MMLRKAIILSIGIQFIILSGCAQNSKPVKDEGNAKPAKEQSSGTRNRLAQASSPYLREHADNPVDWYEWGPEALEKAKRENKPLLVSIGYAACHWCHVMERESFMDSTVARLMNENFVCVKVDREERPDVDQVFMSAAQLLTGSGGWPLNAFALPDGRPFYAGTYFPKDQWVRVLQQLAAAYKTQHQQVVQQAEAITKGIQGQEVVALAPGSSKNFTKAAYSGIYANWKSSIDFKKGGFSRAPKFPLPVGWEFVLQNYYLTGNKEALAAVMTTLDAMAKGGIYDQIGGGFARYSTDADWFAPHFEKMLYDNGQLVSLYAHAYKVTKNPLYAEVIRETLAFIQREMTSPEGGFYASLNADSEGEEGKFYVWTQEEMQQALEEKPARLVGDYFQVKKAGNWERGENILHRESTKEAFAKSNGLTADQWDKLLSNAREKLLKERGKRTRPSTDDKVLTSWNALMLKGYIDAYLALGDEAYLQTALQNARFLEKNMVRKDGRLWRNYKDGKPSIDAFLDDYALLAEAYIHLYQATLDVQWLTRARGITDYAVAHFRDAKSGLFFYTSGLTGGLVVRKMELTDNVMPASNSVMANVLYRLGEYYDHPPYIQMSQAMLHHVAGEVSTGGPYYANWANLMGMMAYGPFEIAVMGKEAVAKSHQMQRYYLPTALFMGGKEENLPLLESKGVEEGTLIYVCRNKTCKMPVKEVQAAMQQLLP
ncbi:thioredoxin domain-containing protein [Hymenobacter antarcticus]